MNRLHFIVEGDTELEFVRSIIKPYLNTMDIFDISISKVPTGKNSKGGMLNYEHIKNDIMRFLKQRQDIIITTFIDYFRLPGTFPDYRNSMKLNNSKQRIQSIESAFFNDINCERFIPYIQLHEFEALLFSSIKGFEVFWSNEPRVIKEIDNIIDVFPNPEDINDNPQTAPSIRLKNIIKRYDKIIYGNLIALEIGIDSILEKCPRFNNWIKTIIDKMKL